MSIIQYNTPMLMVNHALTGILLSRFIGSDLVLAPVALSSHALLDAIPHFGFSETSLHSRRWRITGLIDGLVTCTLVLAACLAWPTQRIHLLVGTLFAVLPDLFYVPEVLLKRRITGKLGHWHHRLQWGENPTGWPVDAGWFIFVGYILYHAIP